MSVVGLTFGKRGRGFGGRQARSLAGGRLAARVLGVVGLAVWGGGAGAGWARGQVFTVAVLPDTQYYCRDNASNPGGANDFFATQTRWVVDNAAAQNIKFVTHLGDVVNTAGVASASTQWNVAVNAMNTLKNSSVPYSILAGNHDWTSTAGTGSLAYYRSRFGNTSSFYSGKSWFQGFDERGVNSAQRFSTPLGDFLHIALEYDSGNPSQSSDATPGTPTNPLAWAQGVIAANWGIPTIISTHNNLNVSAERDGPSTRMIDALVRKNDQVFMVLNGHYASSTVAESRVDSVNDFGHPVYEMLTDYQSRNRGGDGWMRLLQFDPAGKTITAKTYTPIASAALGTPAGAEFGNVGKVETDADSQFVLPMDFSQRFARRIRPETVTVSFQQGTGGYTGAQDTQIRQDFATTTYGGSTVLGVDGDEDNDLATGNTVRHTLIKFDSIFGTGAGQMATTRDVISAKLVLDLNSLASAAADGSGLTAHRMLTGWSAGTATFNNVGTASDGVSISGSSTPDAVARPDSVRGDNISESGVGFGLLEIDVTASIRAFLNGAANNGWALSPYVPNGGNGIFFGSSENSTAGVARPRLVIETTKVDVVVSKFRNGLNGYSGTVDTFVDQSRPSLSFGTSQSIQVDAAVENNSVPSGSDTQALVRFDNVIGTQAGQVPPTAIVTSAILKLNVPADVQFSDGSGFAVYRLTRAWDGNSTWDSLSGGIGVGVDTAVHYDDVAGLDEVSVVAVGFGSVYLNVTESLAAWASGAPNFGWALIPLENATNAIIFDSSERTTGLQPELTVRWIPGPGGLWIPEPSSAGVVFAGCALLGGRRRRA